MMDQLPPSQSRPGGENDIEPGHMPTEAEYLRRLMEEKTAVVVHLRTGESYRGYIEYYDNRFVRITRANAPNLFIFKQDIKYLHEE